MKRFFFSSWIVIIGISIAAGAVALWPAADQPVVWLDWPLPDSQYTLTPDGQQSIELVAHVTDPGTDIVQVEFLADDVVIGREAVTQRAGTLGVYRFGWQPEDSGSYRLSVRAQNEAAAWSQPAEAVVTVTVVTPESAEPQPTGIMALPRQWE